MNPKTLLRHSSLKAAKIKQEDFKLSPYNKMVKPKIASSALLQPIVLRKSKRLLTPPSKPSLQLQELLEHREENKDMIINNEGFKYIDNEYSFQRQETFPVGLNCANLTEKLEEKLKNVGPNDFVGRFDAYFAIFDLVIIADSKYSQILSKIKAGLIDNLKEKYKEKIHRHKVEVNRMSHTLESLKVDNKRHIQKLSELSSQNIDLMTNNEQLSAKCLGLEGRVKLCKDYKGDVNVLLEELRVKSDKIRELNIKLDEMTINECKILQIVEKLRHQGVEFEKIYQETPARKNNDKKLKKGVPIIKIEDLEKLTEA